MRIATCFPLCSAAVMLATTFCVGQSSPGPASDVPQLMHRCRSVSLVSKSFDAPAALVGEKLRQRAEFTDAGLALVDASDAADVRLTVTGKGNDVLIAARRADGTSAYAELAALG